MGEGGLLDSSSARWGLEWWPHGRVAFLDPRGTIHVGDIPNAVLFRATEAGLA